MQKKIKKIIPYFLILLVLMGSFSPGVKVQAQETPPAAQPPAATPPPKTPEQIEAERAAEEIKAQANAAATPAGDNTFQSTINKGCRITSLSGCFLWFIYWTWFQLPTFILWLAAILFNELIYIGISSPMTDQSSFIPTAWAVVRDLSNIFFILILLYIAVQTILGIGHETKKMIVKVIIMALLINFSMFFTKVVIDASNILALVFYNKLQVSATRPGPQTEIKDLKNPNAPRTQGAKDVSGEMQNAFNATRLLDQTFINELKDGTGGERGDALPVGLTIGIIAISGSIMLFAAYALFISGLMFLGRLIELWVLIIFSPFAFMSFALPQLGKTPYVGWDDWSKRLVATSFMAPIFMFFMYLIFLMLPTIFSGFVTGTGFVSTILGVVIPALIVIAMLMKATKYAEKGGGAFGDAIMKGGKALGGLALGAATGGAGMLATGTIGAMAAKAANNDKTRALAASGDKGAQRKLALANSLAGKSFDFRQSGLGKVISKKTGMDFNAGTGALGLSTKSFEGGRKGQVEQKAKAEQEKLKTYELSGDAAVKQNNRKAQYETDKKTAEAFAEEQGFDFKEQDFKADYENNEDMGRHGINRTVGAGSVETVKDINADRKTAYANSQDAQRAKDEAKNVFRKFGEEWWKGAKEMIKTPAGLGTTLTAGVLTGGVGTVVTIAGGGFLRALKQTLSVKASDAEVVASVRKGEDPLKHALHELAKHTTHDEPAHTEPAAASAAAAGGGGAAAHTTTTTH